MTIYVGGLRARLVRDNFFNMLQDSVADLGWLDVGRQHRPVNFQFDPVDYRTELQPNCIAVADDDINVSDEELGTDLAEHRWLMFVDVYAESSSVGIHLSNDVRCILEGRMPSIGRNAPRFTVMDLTQATPTELFVVQIENVNLARGRSFSKPWEKFWYSIVLELVDVYGNEEDS